MRVILGLSFEVCNLKTEERWGIREPEIQEDCVFYLICLFFQFS